MLLGKVYVAPDPKRERFFDGEAYQKGEITFACGKCEATISLDLWPFVSNRPGWQYAFSGEVVEYLKREIKFPVRYEFIRSHDNVFPYLSVVPCEKCNHKHLLYVGFGEISNGHYVGSLQGVYEIIEE